MQAAEGVGWEWDLSLPFWCGYCRRRSIRKLLKLSTLRSLCFRISISLMTRGKRTPTYAFYLRYSIFKTYMSFLYLKESTTYFGVNQNNIKEDDAIYSISLGLYLFLNLQRVQRKYQALPRLNYRTGYPETYIFSLYMSHFVKLG